MLHENHLFPFCIILLLICVLCAAASAGSTSGSKQDTPISLSAHLGYASGAQSPNFLTGKGTKAGFDYNVGASYNITPKLSLGAQYVGVEGNSIDSFSNDAVVGTLKLAF